jgi:hypothetical protein
MQTPETSIPAFAFIETLATLHNFAVGAKVEVVSLAEPELPLTACFACARILYRPCFGHATNLTPITK